MKRKMKREAKKRENKNDRLSVEAFVDCDKLHIYIDENDQSRFICIRENIAIGQRATATATEPIHIGKILKSK